MKTPHSTLYRYSAETIAEANKLTIGTISESAHKMGMTEGEPLIVAMDALLKYAEAYRVKFDSNLADDGFLGAPWLQAAAGIRALLNGDGAVAYKRNVSTDSKDNGCVESMFWSAMALAGFKEEDLN